MYKATFPYEPNSQTDINLDVGDTIYHVEDVGNGWSLGYNKTRGTTGTFPTSFVVKRISSMLKKLSFRNKDIDKVALTGEKMKQFEDVVPRIKAKIPADVLQRRLTHLSGHQRIIGIKLPEIIQKPARKINDAIFQSKQDQHKVIKGILGIFGGFLACCILFVLLRFSYNYTLTQSGYITLVASIPICTALALSMHMRCMMLLMVPSLFTGKGRTVFMTMIFALLLTGPGINIAFNAKQASESMACTQELIYNQTRILQGQLEAPIKKIEKDIYGGLLRLKSVADEISREIRKATNFFNQFSNTLNGAKIELKNIAKACDRKIKSAQTSCENDIKAIKSKCEKELRAIDPTDEIIGVGSEIEKTFRNAFGKKRKRRQAMEADEKTIIMNVMSENPLEEHPETKTIDDKTNRTATENHVLYRYKKMSVLDSLCIFVDIGEICKIVQVGEVGCFVLHSLSFGITETSNSVNSFLNDALNFFYFEIDADIDASGNINSSKTAAQIIKEVKADIESKAQDLLTTGTIVTYILTLSLLFLFIKSVLYMKKFQCNDSYDNFYITKSFKLYDQSCNATGSSSVLPLKQKERRKYVDTRSILLSSKEIEKSKKGLIKVTLHLLIATVIIFFDYFLYFILQLIDRYGHLNVRLGGSTSLNVSVEGTGLISQFLRVFLSQVQIDSDIDVNFNLTTCIPIPKRPDENNIYIFSFLYFFAFVFVIMQAYGLRLRRKIATYFYPERDSKRIIYLHEKIGNNRKMFFSWLKQHLVSKNKQQYMENRISLRGWLEYRHPAFAKHFSWCLPQERMCICCSTNLNGSAKSNKCEKCQSEYCEDCFSDMKYNCLVCKARADSRRRIQF